MRLIRSKFEAWLKSKKPAEIVGHNSDCHACPIALWHVEACHGWEIVIFSDDRHGYVVDRGYCRKPAPWWAVQFMHKIDGSGPRGAQITAGAALEILGAIA